MTKRIIDHHASIVIVKERDLFFFNGYDSGYPRKEWVGFLNPLGGNYEPGDASPLSLLEREVNEEMSNKENQLSNFDKDTANILKTYIMINVKPYQDFIIVDPIIEKNKNSSREQRSAIVSFYEATVPKNLLDAVREVLRKGKRLVSEGDGGSVVSLDDILSGKRLMAWSNPFMISHYLGKQVPFSREGQAESIGLPRNNFQEYLADFEYLKPLKK